MIYSIQCFLLILVFNLQQCQVIAFQCLVYLVIPPFPCLRTRFLKAQLARAIGITEQT